MKTFLAYIVGLIIVVAIMYVVSLVFTGLIPAILALALGAKISNKAIHAITREKPKEYHLFKKNK